ncbi:MAG: type I DNA topoisomerase [Culicoidibacterales bacterium]
MKNLVIVESPAKSKTIEKYLGEDFIVLSSVGHIRDLAKTGKERLGIDVENDFAPHYKESKEKKDVIKELKKVARKADNVYLATDPDREGEAISWHLAEVLKLDFNAENRVVFNEITKDAVLAAFEQPRKIDMDLVHSQESRRLLDRIIGFKLSRLLQNKIKSPSAGRVQSVALQLIVEREREIEAFVPREYWDIATQFSIDEAQFKADLTKYAGKKLALTNESETNDVLKQLGPDYTVTKVTQRKTKKQPKQPFTTSTLQQEAANKLGFAARRTMQLAQKLYEGVQLEDEQVGLITYMRTDSTRLSENFVHPTFAYIEETYGKAYVGTVRGGKVKENAQDAHEAIRPTDITRTPLSIKKYVTPSEFKLYRFIWSRTIAALMSDAQSQTTKVLFDNNGYELGINGSVPAFDGYLVVYGEYEVTKSERLPTLEVGQVLQADAVIPAQHFTNPPARFSEATLIKMLEELGIGRPSTYTAILGTIVARGYVQLEEKRFKPTYQGTLTTDKLKEFFENFINVAYTANMEHDLDLIAQGEEESLAFLQRFYELFAPLVENAYENMEKVPPRETGEPCPECGKPLVYRRGRFGEFVACSGFPECTYIQKKAQEAPKSTGVMCPKCKEGEIVERKTRRGKLFFSCNRYPDCDFAMWERPIVTPCPECQGMLVEKGKKIVCKDCEFSRPKTIEELDRIDPNEVAFEAEAQVEVGTIEELFAEEQAVQSDEHVIIDAETGEVVTVEGTKESEVEMSETTEAVESVVEPLEKA